MPRPLLLVLACLAVLLAGCTAPGDTTSPPSQPPAARTVEERLDAAERQLRSAFHDGAGDVQRINGTAGGGGFTAALDMEFGSNRVFKLGLTLGGFFSVAFYCAPGKGIMQLGEKVLESRGEGQCLEFRSDDSQEKLSGRGDNSTIASSEPQPDGGLQVVLREPNATGGEDVTTLWLDRQDRIVRMTGQDADGLSDAWFHYGPRRPVEVPAANGRAPADVDYDTRFDEDQGIFTWEATGSEDNASLAEFEVRVQDRTDHGNVTLATFQPTAEAQEQGGFRFQFTDSGDGKLGAGDRFTIRNPAWTSEFEHDVVVFDTWAGLGIDESPIPGLEALGVLAGLGAAALAGRRQ